MSKAYPSTWTVPDSSAPSSGVVISASGEGLSMNTVVVISEFLFISSVAESVRVSASPGRSVRSAVPRTESLTDSLPCAMRVFPLPMSLGEPARQSDLVWAKERA